MTAQADQRPKAVLISIRPRYVEQIVAGQKKVELRRTFPALSGAQVFIYESAPMMAVTAVGTIAHVERLPPDVLWERHGNTLGLPRTAYDRYLTGRSDASALHLTDIAPMTSPVPRGALLNLQFVPPQSYRYVYAWTTVFDTLQRGFQGPGT